MILERDTAWFMNELVRGPKENRLNTNMSDVVFPYSFMHLMPCHHTRVQEHRHICVVDVGSCCSKRGLNHTVDCEAQQSTRNFNVNGFHSITSFIDHSPI